MKFNIIFATVLVSLDALCICIQLLDLIWAGSENYISVGFIFDVCLVYPIFVVNLIYFICAICLKRTAYIRTIGLFFMLTVVGCYWLHGLSLERHDRWFIRHGMEKYLECVEDIESNKAILNLVNHRVNDVVSDQNIAVDVYASTNSDGSLFVMFANRSGLPDTDYIFYNGTNRIAASYGRWTINGKFGPYRLISGPWYEY